jgi:hypothetical protein
MRNENQTVGGSVFANAGGRRVGVSAAGGE